MPIALERSVPRTFHLRSLLLNFNQLVTGGLPIARKLLNSRVTAGCLSAKMSVISHFTVLIKTYAWAAFSSDLFC